MELRDDPRLIEAKLKNDWSNETIKYMRGMRDLVGDDREYVRIENFLLQIGEELGALIRELKKKYSIEEIKKELG